MINIERRKERKTERTKDRKKERTKERKKGRKKERERDRKKERVLYSKYEMQLKNTDKHRIKWYGKNLELAKKARKNREWNGKKETNLSTSSLISQCYQGEHTFFKKVTKKN